VALKDCQSFLLLHNWSHTVKNFKLAKKVPLAHMWNTVNAVWSINHIFIQNNTTNLVGQSVLSDIQRANLSKVTFFVTPRFHLHVKKLAEWMVYMTLTLQDLQLIKGLSVSLCCQPYYCILSSSWTLDPPCDSGTTKMLPWSSGFSAISLFWL